MKFKFLYCLYNFNWNFISFAAQSILIWGISFFQSTYKIYLDIKNADCLTVICVEIQLPNSYILQWDCKLKPLVRQFEKKEESKILYNVHPYPLFLFILFFGCTAQHAGSQFPNQGSNPHPPAMEAWSLKHWTARDVPSFIPFKPLYLCLKIYPKEIIRNRHKDFSTIFFILLFITQK